MKRSRTIAVAALGLTLTAAMLITANKFNSDFAIRGETNTYTLTLNSSNKVTSDGDHVVTSNGGGQVTYTYSNVASSTSGHVTLNSGGTFANKDIIHSITGLTVNFSGSLQARTSYDSNTWSEYFTLVSGSEYDLGSNPYFIEFKAINGSSTVNTLTCKYSCLVNSDIPTVSTDYTLVTDASQLSIGSKIVITNSTPSVAMSATQGSNNRGEESITSLNSGQKIQINNNVAEFTLGEGTTSGTYSFKDENGYLCAASSSKNYLRSESTLSSDSSFTVEISSNNATVVSQGSYTRDTIRYNNDSNSGHLFSCYSGGQQPIRLYQAGGAIPAPEDEIGFIATDSNASTYKTSDSFASTNNLVVKAISSDGTQSVLTSGFTYEIRNSSNVVIDPSEPFTNAGQYTLKVSYKKYVPQTINLLVSGSTFNPIVEIANDSISATFNTSDKFSTFLSGGEWGTTVMYADEDMDQIYYANFASNDLEFTLLDPSGVSHDVDTVFGTEGTWTAKVTYTLDPTIKDETEFTVSIVPVQTITLDKSSATIEVDDQLQLEVTNVGPTDATHKEYTWSSSNSSVATVSTTGLVTGVAPGSAVVKATANDGSNVYGQCTITVVAASSVKYTFTNKSWNASPANWTSGADGYGFLDNRGIQVGTTHSGANGTSPVSYSNVTKVVLTVCSNTSSGAGSYNVKVGSTSIGDQSITSSGGTTLRELTFIPSSSVSGNVKITITSTANSIYLYSAEIFTGEPVYPTDISLTSSNTSIGIGETTTINVGYTPSDANVKNLTWSSSNQSVATVSDGVVTGVSVGSATITCTAQGESSTITKTINISVHAISVTSVSLSPNTLSIYVGGTGNLTATVSPANATNKNVSYSSNKTNIATVNSSGVVTGVATGSATITVTTQDGSKTATCSVTVNAAPSVAKTTIRETYQDYHANGYYNCDCTPTTEHPKLLIVPVWFTDSSSYISNDKKESVRQDIGTAYLGTNSETGWRSVKTYYEELSGGRTSLTGTLTSWWECGRSSTATTDSVTETMVEEAKNWYFTNNPSDKKTNYDTDGNGFIDGIILIYGAPDYQKKSGNDNLWAYCYWLQSNNPNKTNPTANVFFWASYDFMYGSNANSRTGHTYGNGYTAHCTIDAHTYIHEMGHVFGIDDYYDYGSGNYKPAGGFSMQDYNIGCHDPYSVMAWGWADPFIPTTSCTIDLHPFQTTKELILLTPEWNAYDSAFDEYLLLELYTPTGLNKFDCDYQYDTYPLGPSTTGIRLWHVSADLASNSSGKWYYADSVTSGDVLHMFKNTYGTSSDHGSIFSSGTGSPYYWCNLLQLIRNKTTETYKSKNNLSSGDLFGNGSSFDMNTFKKQFYYEGLLNDESTLGWSFSVSITGSGDNAVARVTCTKA